MAADLTIKRSSTEIDIPLKISWLPCTANVEVKVCMCVSELPYVLQFILFFCQACFYLCKLSKCIRLTEVRLCECALFL